MEVWTRSYQTDSEKEANLLSWDEELKPESDWSQAEAHNADVNVSEPLNGQGLLDEKLLHFKDELVYDFD